MKALPVRLTFICAKKPQTKNQTNPQKNNPEILEARSLQLV